LLKNLSRYIGAVILFCLGFFFTPSQSYACAKKSTKTEQNSCTKGESDNSKEQDCCKIKSCEKSKEDKGHCSGSCKDKSCNNITSSMGLTPFVEIKSAHSAEAKKQKIGFKEAYYSSGYSSIWQPPKIG